MPTSTTDTIAILSCADLLSATPPSPFPKKIGDGYGPVAPERTSACIGNCPRPWQFMASRSPTSAANHPPQAEATTHISSHRVQPHKHSDEPEPTRGREPRTARLWRQFDDTADARSSTVDSRRGSHDRCDSVTIRMGAGSGNRSCAGSRYSLARNRTPVIAPKVARRTAHTITARPSAKVIPRGTPNAATTALSIRLTTTTTADRKASIHMTARNVRSYRTGRHALLSLMNPGNQRPRRKSITSSVIDVEAAHPVLSRVHPLWSSEDMRTVLTAKGDTAVSVCVAT